VARFILLDAGVVGHYCGSPERSGVLECQEWVGRMIAADNSVGIPEVTYFEVKRGLLRNGSTAKIRRFEAMLGDLEIFPVTFRAWDKAAEFWALLYRVGQPTADPKSLDADALLAAVAVTVVRPGDSAIIATTNERHLNRFPGVDARAWTRTPEKFEEIPPDPKKGD